MSGSSVMYVNMVGDLGSDVAPRARDQGAELTAGGRVILQLTAKNHIRMHLMSPPRELHKFGTTSRTGIQAFWSATSKLPEQDSWESGMSSRRAVQCQVCRRKENICQAVRRLRRLHQSLFFPPRCSTGPWVTTPLLLLVTGLQSSTCLRSDLELNCALLCCGRMLCVHR
ncbi:uncharacterized protein [Triticum aestivum]|uniref:uncharacterized protein n=1 Tax=Triticum aestivum TaxID=4565 RepID=UPI001D030BA8|nr:uncharacterized protein LOC123047522 [Triticum aestivum]